MTMATGGSEDSICPLCLNNFTLPKFLPCFHTFCQHCIDELAQANPNRTFPCPSCRRTTSLPPGGAVALQTNFYLKTSDTTAIAQNMCDLHPRKEREFYCTECDEAICINCKLTRHESHQTEDIHPAINLKKQRLQSDQRRLQEAISDIKVDVHGLEAERISLDMQRSALEERIRQRETAAVEAIRKHVEEQLNLLTINCIELDQNIDKDIKQRETNSVKLSSLLSHVDSVINSETVKDVLSVVEEMTSGRGSQSAVESLTSRERRPTLRPDLHSTVSDDDMTQTTRDYLGTVRLMEMKVTERFRCSEDPETEVFALCHNDCDPPFVIVSYDRLGRNENAPDNWFTESGLCVLTNVGDNVGRISYKRYSKGQCMYAGPNPGTFSTYCKKPAAPHLQLHNNLNGEGVIYRGTVTSTDPFKIEMKPELTINVNRHRAFDVDTSDNYFAVVEEAGTESSSNQVHLYDRSQKTPVSTYHPPVKDCQPTDVLFHHIGGQPVLLVADSLSSALHVLSFQGGQLEFDRYLCEGCPLLQKPSALTVDVHGRVWLGCKGGRIVTVEEFQ